MVSIEGSHGTSVSRANEIQNHGFQLGPGRGGSGVYFWLGPYFIELAEAWFNFRNNHQKRSQFLFDQNRSLAIIIANIEVEEVEILDFNDEELNNRIARVIKSRRTFNIKDDIAISSLYDEIISDLENQLGIKFKIIKLRVPHPPEPYGNFYPIKAIGAPLCCVAREASCIINLNIRRR